MGIEANDFDCPKCRASAGRPCKRAAAYTGQPHPSRIAKAERILRAAAAMEEEDSPLGRLHAFCEAADALATAIEFEVPPIRDGIEVESRCNILMQQVRHYREKREALGGKRW